MVTGDIDDAGGNPLFERFTDRARRVVVLAQEEARLLNHNYIGTEHILLGLIHEGEGVAAKGLESLGISLEAVRSQVEELIGHGASSPSGHIPFTPRAKKVLELSLREALQLGHNYIGTEHILLGLIREGEGVAAQVLVKLGADLSSVRQQVIQLLAKPTYPGQGSSESQERAGATSGGSGGDRIEWPLVRHLTATSGRISSGDRIELRGLRVTATCGVLPEEKARRQPFEVDLDVYVGLGLGLGAPSLSDDLADTVDYGALCALVAGIAEGEAFNLLERFAGRVAEAVLAVPGVDAVTVTVRKLRPPVPEDLATSGVRIHRTT